MNDFLLARVAVIWADTPKSATERWRRGGIKGESEREFVLKKKEVTPRMHI